MMKARHQPTSATRTSSTGRGVTRMAPAMMAVAGSGKALMMALLWPNAAKCSDSSCGMS